MSQTVADLLSQVEDAIYRLVAGAKMCTVNGQQYQFEDLTTLRAWRKELKIEAAEAAGTDGRGSWEVAFSE